ncbi:MAG: hypothetical protein PUB13_02175 [Lachnospiraceae bacterium]|nr:hypothetical protein [Lachnospiraceae bacterium]
MPSSTMNVPYHCEKVGDVTLPEGWAWQDADKDKELTAGTAVSATAVYDGADKGNYVNETVSVSITRKKHKKRHCQRDYQRKRTVRRQQNSEVQYYIQNFQMVLI